MLLELILVIEFGWLDRVWYGCSVFWWRVVYYIVVGVVGMNWFWFLIIGRGVIGVWLLRFKVCINIGIEDDM